MLLFFSQSALAYNYDDALRFRKEGDNAKSLQIFKSLVKDDPQNSELWFYVGLLQRIQGDFDEAMKSQQKALKISPENNDVKLEIARIHVVNGDFDKAELLIDQILSSNSTYKEAEKLLVRIEKIKFDFEEGRVVLKRHPYSWYVDTGYERSRFSREVNQRKEWRNSFLQVGHRVTDKTLVHAKIHGYKRADKHEENYEVGADHVFNKNYNAGLDVAYTQKSEFLAKWKVKARGEARVVRDHKYIGDTWLVGDVQSDRYQNFDIYVMKYGARYHITDNLDVTGVFIDVVDQNDDVIRGRMGRVNYQTPWRKLRVFGGYASAPETQNSSVSNGQGFVVQTRTVFYGGSYKVSDNITLHLAYTRDDRENSFIRKVVSSTISLKF